MDGIEEQLQINHLGHFLLCSLLLPDMQKAKDARMIIVGSITGINQELSRGTLLFNVSNNMLWIAFVICYLLIFFSRVVVKDHNRVWKCRKCHF